MNSPSSHERQAPAPAGDNSDSTTDAPAGCQKRVARDRLSRLDMDIEMYEIRRRRDRVMMVLLIVIVVTQCATMGINLAKTLSNSSEMRTPPTQQVSPARNVGGSHVSE